MANTYTQLLVQIVFTVRGRANLISEEIRQPLEKYICGIISSKKSKPLAIYCNPDHCHVLIGLHPTISVSEIAQSIKSNSARWLNEHEMIGKKFNWQVGFGAFTYSQSALDNVVKYILNQKEHHKKTTFRDEYLDFLEQEKVEFDHKFLFDFMDGTE